MSFKEIRAVLGADDYTRSYEQKTTKQTEAQTLAELERASSEFLSYVPAGTRFYPNGSPTQRAIKAASLRIENSRGNSTIALRVSAGPLGGFSDHDIEAEVVSFLGNTTRSSLVSDKNTPPSALLI